MKKTMSLIAMMAAAASSPALAHSEGDIIVRAGAAYVSPNDSSDKILNSQDEFSIDSDTQLGLTVGYMITDNFSVELLAATPFKHAISTSFGNLGDIGETKHLPPTLMVQYYFGTKDSKFRPYVGAGINYTTFFDEELNSNAQANGLSDLRLEDSWGLAANVGADYEVYDNWYVNGSIWYADIDTEASYKVGTDEHKTDVSIDPWVFMIAVGYSF
ncbi:Outer membrane protein W precursor [Grimontia celer]|uniref:Outer membrane protein W n=1 Tax=Grimontia celer TaxID=1796497 RepID=A0A128F9Q3_9GAMM|nr:outer membrane protein OmpW [Grimontia celer]CZF83029.1 Outer membrane protein W precursor [Grimontia celer]CZF83036.1 Outer membrane protein W precursor [Grimontia celer]